MKLSRYASGNQRIHPLKQRSWLSSLAWGLSALLLMLAGCGAPTQQSDATPVPVITLPPSTPSATATSATTGSDWTTYHGDSIRSGYRANEPDAHRLQKTWSMELDGSVYAEPLVIGNHLIVVTEKDALYSLDARTGAIEWRIYAGQPVPLNTLPCGNIDPLGITGTPVYDPATGLIFAVAEVSGPQHVLVGVDLNTGKIKVQRTIDPPGADPAVHQQRAALALSHGMVYIAFGGLYGDCGNYHGRVVAVNTSGQGDLLTYQVPTTREAGIWAPPGPVMDADGNLFVSVGNGEVTQGDWDHSDSVLKLSPTLQLLDGFAPTQWPQDNAGDADLGSMSPVLLPNGLIFAAGKSGHGYLLRANALGGVGGQIVDQSVCHAYGGAATDGSQIFVPCNDGLRQVLVGPGETFKLGWQAAGNIKGSPVITAHTVYSVDQSGKFYALNKADGSVIASIAIGATSRFATPTLSAGRIFIGTLTGIVAITVS